MQRSALLCLLALAGASAAHADTFMDRARVRSAQPRYEAAAPREVCTTRLVTEARPVAPAPNYGGIAIGAVVGGVLGNQVGQGHGREAATAAGAVAGAMVGDRVAGGGQPQYEQVQREVRTCRTVADAQPQLTGYDVVYEFRGRDYRTFLRDNPGEFVPVRVSVEPVQPVDGRRP